MKKLRAVVVLAAVAMSFVASAAEKAVAVGMSDGKLVFYYDEDSHGEGTVYSVALAESSSQPPWYSDRANFTKVVFDASFADYRPASCQAWFQDLANVVAFEGLEYLDVSETTRLREMFSGCASITELDLKGFDTAKATMMAYMFENCSSLKTIYVQESFVTNALTDSGNNMFKGCTSLVGGNDTAFDSGNVGKDYAQIDRKGYPGYFACPPTAKAVVKDDGATLRFVYDSRDYGYERSDWYSVAEAEEINPLKDEVPWYNLRSAVTRVYFDDSFRNYRPSQLGSWFYNFAALNQISGIKNLDASEATAITYMFYGCSSLTTLYLSHFRTANVTNMAWAFSACSSLTTIDLSEFDTKNVTSMKSMFKECSKLETIYTRSDFDLGNVENDTDMFKGCTSLVGGAETGYDANHVDAEYARIDKSGTPGYFTEAPKSAVAVGTPDGRLVFYYDNADHTYEGSVYSVALAESSSPPPWYSARANFTKVVFDASFSDYKPSSCSFWFKDLANVVAFEGLRYLDTSDVTGMSYMFYGCSGVTELDLASFNTAKVTQMNNMFAECSSLTTIYTLDRFVTTAQNFNGNNMFKGCDKLKGGNGTSVATEKIYDATYAKIGEGTQKGYFARPKLAIAVYDSASKCLRFYYDANNHANEGNVFYVPGQQVDPTWSSSSMVKGGTTNVKFTVSFAAFRPTSCGSWFSGFRKLEGIDGLGYLNVSETRMFNSMFNYCENLKTLDLSGFDTAKVQNMYHMFAGCTSLVTIVVSAKFTTEGLRSETMPVFTGCKSLVGGKGTTYDAENVSAEYARIDGGEQAPGYFTSVPPSAVAVGTPDGRLVFYYDAADHEDEGTVYSVSVAELSSPPPWYSARESFTKVVFDASFSYYKPSSCSFWFKDLANVVAFEGLRYLDTSDVTGMSYMFYGCSSVTELDLASFNTAKVTQMNNMFADCSSLTTIYTLDRFVTTAQNFNGNNMFKGCDKLKGGNGSSVSYYKIYDGTYARIGEGTQVGYFTRPKLAVAVYDDASKILKVYYDAKNHADEGNVCYAPGQSVDPTWSSMSKVRVGTTNVIFTASFAEFRPTSCGSWFSGFSKLEGIDGLEFLNVSETRTLNSMFNHCAALKTLDLSGFDTAKVQNMYHMFAGCTSLETILVSTKFTTEGLRSEAMPVFTGCESLVGGAGTAYDAENVSAEYARIDGGTSAPGYFTEKLTAVAVLSSDFTTLSFYHDEIDHSSEGKVYKLSDAESRLPSEMPPWYIDFEYNEVTTVVFDDTFAGYAPKHCGNWFCDYGYLETVTGIENLDVSEATDMRGMFSGCISLKTLDLSGFDTSCVTNMCEMFFGCEMFEAIDLSSFDTANVTDMESMFAGCSDLGSLGLTGFDTSGVITMKSMFSGCMSLASLDLSTFDTSNVKDMSSMFFHCPALKSLDLTNFNTANVSNMDGMFMNCSQLTSICVTDGGFVTSAVESSAEMFANCNAIVGGKGTAYDANHVDAEYARIDGTPAMTHEGTLPGYFTGKAEPIGFQTWADSQGLSGADAAWDAKPAKWGGKWANAFIYTYGEGLADGSTVIMRVAFDAYGMPIVTTAPAVDGHADFTAAVIGTSEVSDWKTPVELERNGDNWTLPAETEANFFRVRLTQ